LRCVVDIDLISYIYTFYRSYLQMRSQRKTTP